MDSSSSSNSDSSAEKCCCDKNENAKQLETNMSNPTNNSFISGSNSKDKKHKLTFQSLGFNLKRGRSRRNKKNNASSGSSSTTNTNLNLTPKNKWSIKFNCTRSKEPKVAFNEDNQKGCHCTCYRKTQEEQQQQKQVSVEDCETTSSAAQNEEIGLQGEAAAVVVQQAVAAQDSDSDTGQSSEHEQESSAGIYRTPHTSNIPINAPFLDIAWMTTTVHEDCDEAARLARAREIEQGVEAPANFRPVRSFQILCSDMEADAGQPHTRLQLVCPPDLTVDSLRSLFQNHVTLKSCTPDSEAGWHTQIDFIHCLVPDLNEITNCSFYWGKMDRYEAERLLDGKQEGTFLLRDSAQEEFLFSVSFRKYGRSLHARIEQWNHKFSFDAHDPGVYTSNTVCGLIEHYKDPSSCMFFEPMLTWPLHRNFVFSLQHLCRATIVSHVNYDNITQLQLPKTLKSYMREYHYRQKVRVARFDDDVQWIELGNF